MNRADVAVNGIDQVIRVVLDVLVVAELKVDAVAVDPRPNNVNTKLLFSTPAWLSLKVGQSSCLLSHAVDQHAGVLVIGACLGLMFAEFLPLIRSLPQMLLAGLDEVLCVDIRERINSYPWCTVKESLK